MRMDVEIAPGTVAFPQDGHYEFFALDPQIRQLSDDEFLSEYGVRIKQRLVWFDADAVL